MSGHSSKQSLVGFFNDFCQNNSARLSSQTEARFQYVTCDFYSAMPHFHVEDAARSHKQMNV